MKRSEQLPPLPLHKAYVLNALTMVILAAVGVAHHTVLRGLIMLALLFGHM